MPKYMLMIDDAESGGVSAQIAFDPPLPEAPIAGFCPSQAQVLGFELNKILHRLLTPPPDKDDNIIQLPPRDITIPAHLK